ncbi:TPA: hypothetical protein ACUI6X_005314 [Klebsiella pneumoniae]|uniref:Uncharacterized protein n=3 Tax=Klebsiella pneumoniae TaxID=573 RepID=A0A483J576_KLEPN|nr:MULTISPECIES: hypothetical protein [Klebsiella]HBQ3201976.1 hypothetical protein [Klebsiella variicola subsp. variicola]HCD1361717.1 hypothetical protein [Klebsiella pneumoniae subsp. pneumoniae]ARA44358.1 hypothetical protein AM364_28740 [Klebsiella pneumoniae]EJG9791519.1 hypothetical protein [Klebsiella pneumoniae]EKU6511861.1 hypothetical protein [Klebsiella pneumoniae]
MTLWTDSYQSSIDSISNFIDNNFTHYNEIPENLSRLDDSVLADCIIVVAWRYFKNLYIHRRDSLNKYTSYNQKFLHQGNTPSLQELKDDKFYFLNKILRILFEYNFWASDDFGPPMFLSPEILEKLDKLKPPSDFQVNFIWIERSMPAALTKDLLLSDKFSFLTKIAVDVENLESTISHNIEKGLEDVENKTNELREQVNELIQSSNSSIHSLNEYDSKLKEYKSDYNFVLLSKAFSNLRGKKRTEFQINNFIVLIFSLCLTCIPLIALANHIKGWYIVELNLSSLAYYLPLLSLELLLFYFMRLYYIEGKAIKAQLLQIDQRLSLCEFIHDYVETKKNSGAEKESWSLFEKLIFSPIQVTSENIPSLLDGASSIAELAGKVLSKDSK